VVRLPPACGAGALAAVQGARGASEAAGVLVARTLQAPPHTPVWSEAEALLRGAVLVRAAEDPVWASFLRRSRAGLLSSTLPRVLDAVAEQPREGGGQLQTPEGALRAAASLGLGGTAAAELRELEAQLRAMLGRQVPLLLERLRAASSAGAPLGRAAQMLSALGGRDAPLVHAVELLGGGSGRSEPRLACGHSDAARSEDRLSARQGWHTDGDVAHLLLAVAAFGTRPSPLLLDNVSAEGVMRAIRLYDPAWSWSKVGPRDREAVLSAAPSFLPDGLVEARPVHCAVMEEGDVLFLAPLAPHGGEASAHAPLSGAAAFAAVSTSAARYDPSGSHCSGAHWGVRAGAKFAAAECAVRNRGGLEARLDTRVPAGAALARAYAALHRASDALSRAQGAASVVLAGGARTAASRKAVAHHARCGEAYERAVEEWWQAM